MFRGLDDAVGLRAGRRRCSPTPPGRAGSGVKGVPRWCDRFGQYGIKVSFWGSTLKIVIYVENYETIFSVG